MRSDHDYLLDGHNERKQRMAEPRNPHLKAGSPYAKDFAQIGRDTKELNRRREALVKSVEKKN
ncbi:hypothetical protein [Sphingomonas sp. VNH70]|uniref:hypothetical protein n=1 Tax=Sphingomonas silueang TaxID=3156617 RepID=UPI0032B435DF